MITTEQFKNTHLDTRFRAECLTTLANAAILIAEEGTLPDKQERMDMVLGIIEAVRVLSLDLSATAADLADVADRELSKTLK